ncbi:hypothetical protein N0V88_004804 [Collariella sp. IMI 366227]|nr:hypothetical protein N0V88_004804 [Collariella sp. IMI 366227]
MLDTTKASGDPARHLFQQNRALNSPVVQVFLRPFSKPTILIDDVREVKDILGRRTREFDRAPSTRNAFRPIIPHASLVKVTGAEFKNQRRFWEGVMGTAFLRRVTAPRIHRVAQDLVDLLRTKATIADGRPFSMFDDFDLAAFDIIWTVVFGTDLEATRKQHTQTLKEAALGSLTQPPSRDVLAWMPERLPMPDMFDVVSSLIRNVEKTFGSFSQPLYHWYLRQKPAYKRMLTVKNRIVNGLLNSTRSRLAQLSEKELQGLDESSALVMGIRRELLARLQQSGGGRKPLQGADEIGDELLMILIAVRPLFLNPIPYLDAIIEESLRLANISSRLIRTVTSSHTTVLGYPIPKGAQVICNPYVGRAPVPGVGRR